MKKAALILGIITSTLSFSQNNSEVVDVVVNGKIQTEDDTETQNYIANYLTNFFEKTYEKTNGFYLVSEQKTQNNRRNSLKMDEFPFLVSKDIKKVTLKSNGNKFPTVIFEFKKKASEKLNELTSNNIGNGIALIIDKKIITMPMISKNISNGKIEYNSSINFEETQNLTEKIKK
jgi:preprotein translocase subunit SecD